MSLVKLKTFEEFKKEKIPKGIYSGVPHDEYNDAPGIRRSSMVNLLRSAKYYDYRKKNPMAPTDALTFGSAFHTALLEPDEWGKHYVIGPSESKRTKKWKDFKTANEDMTVIHPDDYVVINRMLKEIRGHDFAQSFIEGNPVEESAWAELDGQLVKARSDISIPSRGILADIKTTQDASYEDFQRSAWKYKYDVQAAYYMDTFNAAIGKNVYDKFVFIAIEKNEPHDIQLFVADPTFIKAGRAKYKQALKLLKECEKSGVWPGYQDQVVNLTLPSWAN